jgi:transcriptional regulator with XRE-family HTH domain
MTSGEAIREARLLAGLSQQQLAELAGVPRPSIVRWERGAVEPAFEMVRRLLRACGFDLALVRYSPDEAADDRLSRNLQLTPQERLRAVLDSPETSTR